MFASGKNKDGKEESGDREIEMGRKAKEEARLRASQRCVTWLAIGVEQ